MFASIPRGVIMILAGWLVLSPDDLLAGPTFDPYGGYKAITGNNTSGFFRVQQIGDRFFLVTPDNHAMISLAVDTANFYDGWGGRCPTLESYPNPYNNRAKYNKDQNAWRENIKANLAHWGFNSLGCWCEQGVPELTESVRCLHIAGVAYRKGVAKIGRDFPDVFDPNFDKAADEAAKSLAPYAKSRYRIGTFPDNELGWVGADYWGKTNGPTLPDGFIAQPATTPGKQHWAGRFLRRKHRTIDNLNAAYGTSFTGFTGEGNTLVNATELPNNDKHPAIFEDKKDFVELIADIYYRTVTRAMRKYDPHHLIFSARWALWTTAFHKDFKEYQDYNERIWTKAGQYCDIIAINSYMDNASLEAEHKLYGRVFAQTHKPFMITEWATFADDTQYEQHPTWQRYQHQRGIFYFNQMKVFLDFAFPDADGKPVHPCVGTQWFQYYDEPSLGRTDGEKVNFGLLNVKDEPYQTALDIMGTFNAQLYDYIANGTPLRLIDAPTPKTPAHVPDATIAIDEPANARRVDVAKIEKHSARPEFTWTAPQEATTCTLLYSPEKCFPAEQTVRIENLEATSYKPAQPLASGLWYWCVRAVDSAGLGGKYSDPIAFYVDKPAPGGDVGDYLGFEDLSAWRNVSLEDGGWDGVTWAFPDTDKKTTGQSSARVQFTVNSINKLTGKMNEKKSEIVWRYTGPAPNVSGPDTISCDLMTGRATDSAGEMTVASRYVSLRVKDNAGTILLDTRIDSDGSTAPLEWKTFNWSLNKQNGSPIASVEFYVDTTIEKVPWDQRLTIWLDNLAVIKSN